MTTIRHTQKQQHASRRWRDIASVLLSLAGLYSFTTSFFLAKRSLAQRSSCKDDSLLLLETMLSPTELRHLEASGYIVGAHDNDNAHPNSCWTPRHTDSLVILLVDALRFDFAYYNLPNSIGQRLTTKSSSQLFQFVADPPTVTMQRLKALTTGGLPTFADISANMGGATVEEDSWMYQMKLNSAKVTDKTARDKTRRMAFVGDDTWEDLFPGYFDESYPYPSFNTRDLNTVDDGCLHHLPDLLSQVIRSPQQQQQQSHNDNNNDDPLEVLVVHFLGVDHVGHTYGPHNEHMAAKLHQMDQALASTLDQLDQSAACHTTYIFGDHGMTEDGNHGGGTPEETSAALFVHFSANCPATSPEWARLHERATTNELIQQSSRHDVEEVFSSIHQIDLVSTLSIGLGLPIPYANLGSFVPALLPGQSLGQAATILALNAAQVWRYLQVYSATANRLPGLDELWVQLDVAMSAYRDAIREEMEARTNLDAYQRAASLFKSFLQEALELGQRVWTRFDTTGMMAGIVLLALSFVILLWSPDTTASPRLPVAQYWEVATAILLMIYYNGLLTFSNSYILEEEGALGFSLTLLCSMVAFRLYTDHHQPSSWWTVLLVPILGRIHASLVNGHGMDPSIQLHGAHHSVVFLSSLISLVALRCYCQRKDDRLDVVTDVAALLLVAVSWWDKRASSAGFGACRLAIGLWLVSFVGRTLQGLVFDGQSGDTERRIGTATAKFVGLVMIVTGPAAATSVLIVGVQLGVLYRLNSATTHYPVHPAVSAALIKLVTRHTFFATNHGCSFSRLQLSAAFVATDEFQFAWAGTSLFLNTFGWEMVGLVFTWTMSHRHNVNIWRYYSLYQVGEAIASCISVSILRRHLMVWDIYAPHFLFAGIFTILNRLFQLTVIVLSE